MRCLWGQKAFGVFLHNLSPLEAIFTSYYIHAYYWEISQGILFLILCQIYTYSKQSILRLLQQVQLWTPPEI